jgi:uncharacterized protein
MADKITFVVEKLLFTLLLTVVLLTSAQPCRPQNYLDQKLLDAPKSGNVKKIRAYLAKGAHVNYADDEDWSVLMEAVDRGNLAIVRVLVNKGANLNPKNCFGETALTRTALGGKVDIVRSLAEKGAVI